MTDILRHAAVAASLVAMLWTNLAGGGGRADEDRDPGM